MNAFKLMLIAAYNFPFLTQPAFVSTVSVLLSAMSVLCVRGRERVADKASTASCAKVS